MGVMCWNFGAWTTVRARAFWMCWRRFIWYFGIQCRLLCSLYPVNGLPHLFSLRLLVLIFIHLSVHVN